MKTSKLCFMTTTCDRQGEVFVVLFFISPGLLFVLWYSTWVKIPMHYLNLNMYHITKTITTNYQTNKTSHL